MIEKRKFVAIDISIAIRTSPSAALVYEEMKYLSALDLDNVKEHDGKIWLKTSIKDLSERTGFLSIPQIRLCLSKLVDEGYLKKGNFNRRKNDNTIWYNCVDELNIGDN